MASTEAQKKAQRKYGEKFYTCSLRLPLEMKEEFQAASKAVEFLVRARTSPNAQIESLQKKIAVLEEEITSLKNEVASRRGILPREEQDELIEKIMLDWESKR